MAADESLCNVPEMVSFCLLTLANRQDILPAYIWYVKKKKIGMDYIQIPMQEKNEFSNKQIGYQGSICVS